jgi:hypothetical protein
MGILTRLSGLLCRVGETNGIGRDAYTDSENNLIIEFDQSGDQQRRNEEAKKG